MAAVNFDLSLLFQNNKKSYTLKQEINTYKDVLDFLYKQSLYKDFLRRFTQSAERKSLVSSERICVSPLWRCESLQD